MPDDQEAITLEEAAEVLGISREAGPAQVERAYAEKLEGLEKKLAQAATAALKNKYRLALERLKLAREVMENQDTGSDLPSLEAVQDVPASPPPVTKTEPAPAPKPEPKAEPKPEPKPELKPAPKVEKPAAPKKPLPVKMIGIAAAAVLAIGAAVFFLKPHPAAKFAGDYRKRINYETVIYDYAVNVSSKGVLSGMNQVADKKTKAINITGQVDEKGVITAKGDDKSVYTGTIEGDVMKLEEKPDGGKSLFYSLTKGMELPKETPQAEYAGVYHSPSVEYPNGSKFEFEFKLEPNGDLAGTSKSLKSGDATKITGRVNTRGKLTAECVSDKVTYEGEVKDDALVLKEKLENGEVLNIKVTKGLKERVAVKPAAPPPPPKPAAYRFAGLYHEPSIPFPSGEKFDIECVIKKDATLDATLTDLKDGSKITFSCEIDKKDLYAHTVGKLMFSGYVVEGELSMRVTFADKSEHVCKISKGAKEKAPMTPAADFAGTYRQRIAYPTVVYDYEIIVAADGTLSGSNIVADRTGKVIKISGTVDSKGAISAKGDDKSVYGGTIEDGKLKMKEIVNNGEDFFFTLGKDVDLPKVAPQVNFAGVYHNHRIVDANGDAYEYKFIIEENGDLAGYYTRAINTETPKMSISGRVNTVGKITAESEAYSDGRKTTFAGKVVDKVMQVIETTVNGKTFEYQIAAGEN